MTGVIYFSSKLCLESYNAALENLVILHLILFSQSSFTPPLSRPLSPSFSHPHPFSPSLPLSVSTLS